ncbi:MAG: HDOD domain-containing protein, partial [Burkholderiaceae bacterium]
QSAAVTVEVSPAAPAARRLPPPQLAQWRPRLAGELEVADRVALIRALAEIPRPPRAFHQLASPEFVSSASSSQLSELVTAEPVIAAKVMATVNSPLYGLQRPVTSIGQSVTFLGINSVRVICMRYMLSKSFHAGSPALRTVYDEIWAASALASELCFKLAQQLGLAEPGALVTQVVLSFLGRFAALALLPPEVGAAYARQGMLQRSITEQQRLELAAPELSGLLMQGWGLPPALLEDVLDSERILVTPCPATLDARGAGLALCYLCARLGERLAAGADIDLAAFDPAEAGPEFFYLGDYLQIGPLRRVGEALRSAELLRSVSQLRGRLTNPRPAP